MSVAPCRSHSRPQVERVIAWISVVVAFVPLAGRSEAGGTEPRTWRLSDAHTNSVNALSFSPDGKTLASASRDGTVKLWDLTTGRAQSTLDAHPSVWTSVVAYSPDGKTIASGSEAYPRVAAGNSTIKLWDVASGRLRATIGAPTSLVGSLVFSRDGEILASADGEGAASLWEVSTGQLRSRAKLSGIGGAFAFAPDLKTAAVLGRDYTILLVDVATGQERATLKGHRNNVYSLAFSPDGKALASGAGEPSMGGRGPSHNYPSEVKLWDLSGETPGERASLTGLALEIWDVAFSPDGRMVAAGGFGQEVRVWDAVTGAVLADLEASCNMISTIAFSPDGASLAVGGLFQSISVWNTGTWSERTRLVGRIAYRLAYAPDGKSLAAGLSDGTVALWDVNVGRVRTVLQGHTQRVTALAVSHDGKRLAAGGEDGVITIWDPATGVRRGRNSFGHTGAVTSLAFSPDGMSLASGGMDATVRVGGVTWPSVRAVLRGHNREVSSVAFSPDGKTLASADHAGTVRLWDVAEGRGRSEFRVHTFRTSKSKEETKVIDGETVTMRVAIPGETEDQGVPIYCMDYSPDGGTIATGDRAISQVGGVSLRDAVTGEERAAFKQSTGGAHAMIEDVNALSFSPDSRLLALAGYNTVRITDAATGQVLAALKTGSSSPIRDLTFSPDGKTIASSGYQFVQFWDVEAALKQEAVD